MSATAKPCAPTSSSASTAAAPGCRARIEDAEGNVLGTGIAGASDDPGFGIDQLRLLPRYRPR